MQKELLLTIGDDHATSYNLRFLKEVFSSFCDIKLTLFYVTPRHQHWAMDTTNLIPQGEHFHEFAEHTKSKGEKALEKAARWISEIAGCSDANIQTKVVHSQKGTVRELIDEARSGMYDAMLLGRRAFTWFEEVFENSVCHELLWHDIDFPIWVCKKPPANPRHDMLLCLDGSSASLRMVDHAGYMLAEEKQHTFTLFHVTESSSATAKTQQIFDEGLALLAENGVDEERVQIKMVTGSNTLKATLKEAIEGNYSAVGVGKHGMDAPTRMQDMFPSSVTINLLRQLTDASLWISK